MIKIYIYEYIKFRGFIIKNREVLYMKNTHAISSPTLDSNLQENATTKIEPRKYLVNKLNFYHFQNKNIAMSLKHVRFKRAITVQVKVEPCVNDKLVCYWEDKTEMQSKIDRYSVEHIIVSDDKEVLLAKPELLEITEEKICMLLPETCYRFSTKKINTYPCSDIKVNLLQNSCIFTGSLLEFSPVSFRIRLEAKPPQTFDWISLRVPANLIFYDQDNTYYSGECEILNEIKDSTKETKVYELKPVNQQMSRFRPKEFRSIRQTLVPSPDIRFEHPLTKKNINLKVKDISGSGLSVEEYHADSVLLPGLIIPDLRIYFANSFQVKCVAQVVYRNIKEEDQKVSKVKCGITFLDMNIEDHLKLLSLLQQAQDECTYICNQVDMDKLWNFLFETGFIYPEKYEHLKDKVNKLKETYEKLYLNSPSIARHFVYQDNGEILGHMSMLRFYNNSWMIHHHAALTSKSRMAGIKVLMYTNRYLNVVQNLASAHLGYVFCYFRPDNKFPKRVFGGVAKYLNDPQKCSLDTFAYFYYSTKVVQEKTCIDSWKLTIPDRDDLMEFKYFYEQESNGLIIDAFDLVPEASDCFELANEYAQQGFRREKHLFALKQDGELKALVIFNITDFGLNMSDLTNCIKLLIIDSEGLDKNILYSILNELLTTYKQKSMSVLIYPYSYLQEIDVGYEKLYSLWILNVRYFDQYLKFCNRLLRIT